jgi:hypothetical protein
LFPDILVPGSVAVADLWGATSTESKRGVPPQTSSPLLNAKERPSSLQGSTNRWQGNDVFKHDVFKHDVFKHGVDSHVDTKAAAPYSQLDPLRLREGVVQAQTPHPHVKRTIGVTRDGGSIDTTLGYVPFVPYCYYYYYYYYCYCYCYCYYYYYYYYCYPLHTYARRDTKK